MKRNRRKNPSYLVKLWACDMQNSSFLDNNKKKVYMDIVSQRISDALKELGDFDENDNSYEDKLLLCKSQFRGDGFLLSFKPEIDNESVLEFTKEFCKMIKECFETEKIEEDFKIRTYLTIANVNKSSISNGVTGKEVDNFCKIVDNKSSDDNKTINLKSDFLSLVITEKCWDLLQINPEEYRNFTKISILGQECYAQYYEINFFCIKYLCNKSNIKVVQNTFEKAFKNAGLWNKLKNNKDTYDLLCNEENCKKLYTALLDCMNQLKNCVTTLEADTIIFFLDVETNNEFNTHNLVDLINNKSGKRKVSLNLIWTDVCLDVFENVLSIPMESNEYKYANKNILNKIAYLENMRIYKYNFLEKGLEKDKKSIRYSELNEISVYIHSFDYGVKDLFNRIVEGEKLENFAQKQLEMGLLLCDSVVIHSAECLRSDIAYDILSNYENFVQDGSIKLIFSSKVKSIQEGFPKYIEDKIVEYQKSEFGKDEAESLQNALSKTNHLIKVIQLIEKTPVMLKRDTDGTSSYESLLQEDMKAEACIVCMNKESFRSINNINLEWTIYQLLNAKYKEKGKFCSIISEENYTNIIQHIERSINGVISAGIVIKVFDKYIPDNRKTESFEGWYNALIYRANYLYAKVNAGNLLLMEYLPPFNKNTIFDCIRFADIFDEVFPEINDFLGSKLIARIRQNKELLSQFRLYYINAVLLRKENKGNSMNVNFYKENIIKAKELLKKIISEKEV